ncbi:MAG: hypothetical protein M0P13_06855 [Fibrobacteraceae bacterium]|nr:hypothetical protein [Fibrobacteraceae bacterium]
MQDFLKTFNQCKVRYMIVGGASVILHGYARTTVDLDDAEHLSKMEDPNG